MVRVIETIKKEMKKHIPTEPVPINYLVASIPTIVHYANQGDPAGENEETISHRRFVEILFQFLVLLNLLELNTALESLKAKKYSLNYKNKTSVMDVTLGVSTLLSKVGRSKKEKVNSPLAEEVSPLQSKYDVSISFYASVTNSKYISRSSTTLGLIIQAISTHKNDKKPISLKNFGTFLKAALLLGETENTQNVQKFLINRRVYMEKIFHILHIIGSEHVQKFMEELYKTMENLSYDTKISLNDVNLGLGLIHKAITA